MLVDQVFAILQPMLRILYDFFFLLFFFNYILLQLASLDWSPGIKCNFFDRLLALDQCFSVFQALKILYDLSVIMLKLRY